VNGDKMKTVDAYGKTKEEIINNIVLFLESNGVIKIIEIENPVNREFKYYASLTVDDNAPQPIHFNAVK
jgi:hypothetical protein